MSPLTQGLNYRSACDDHWFDDKLISKLVSGMADGKAAGLDQLSSEHLKYSHLVVVCTTEKNRDTQCTPYVCL